MNFPACGDFPDGLRPVAPTCSIRHYQNSVDSYNNFIANGVNSSLVEFIPLESRTHSTGAIPYMIDIFDKFENLK